MEAVRMSDWRKEVPRPEAACIRAAQLCEDLNWLYLGRLIEDESEVVLRAVLQMRMRDRYTLLHTVVEKKHPSLVRQILATKLADIEAVTDAGRTALHLAARVGNMEIFEALVQAGADLDARWGESRVSAASVALSFGHPEIVKRLWQLGARLGPACKNGEGYSALEGVAFLDDVDIFDLLVSTGEVEADPVTSLVDIVEYAAPRIIDRCFGIPALAALLAECSLDPRIDAKMHNSVRQQIRAWKTGSEVLRVMDVAFSAEEEARSQALRGPAL
jgi:ankyrin repeat protein